MCGQKIRPLFRRFLGHELPCSERFDLRLMRFGKRFFRFAGFFDLQRGSFFLPIWSFLRSEWIVPSPFLWHLGFSFFRNQVCSTFLFSKPGFAFFQLINVPLISFDCRGTVVILVFTTKPSIKIFSVDRSPTGRNRPDIGAQ